MNKNDYVELRRKFIKSNKVKRERHAQIKGYANAAEYLAFLDGKISGAKSKVSPKSKDAKSSKKSKKTKVTTIHNVHILDRSTSMMGKPLRNALKGINKELEELKAVKNVNYSQTFVHFGSTYKTEHLLVPLNKIKKCDARCAGATALYQTVGETLERLEKKVPKGDKVLVKIFTDGWENVSSGKYRKPGVLAKYISKLEEKGYTITFVGAKDGVEFMAKEMGINHTNILGHDNTAKGIADAYVETRSATKTYSASVSRGEDVTHGFYKKQGTL